MSYSHEALIDQATGEFDWTYIKQWSMVRAAREFGGPVPPVSYVRDAIRYYKGFAEIMRRRWRSANGLPDDTVYVTITPYGNQQDGVRRSAF